MTSSPTEAEAAAPSRRARAVLGLVAAALPCLLLLALGYRALLEQGFFLVDDAYITFRYARNLALGHGLVWNAGEPVEGYTNLLWVLLLAPFGTGRLHLIAPALSALAACASLELLRRIARRIWPDRSPLLHALPAFLLASNPSFAYWSVQGMETPLFAFLTLLAGDLLIRARSREPASPPVAPPGAGRLRVLVGLTLAAAYLTRPEGLLVAALFLSIELLRAGSLRDRIARVLPPALMLAAVVGLHLAFRLHTYGEPLPNTFYAKVILGWVSVGRGVHHLKMFRLAGGALALPGLLLLLSRARPSPVRPYLVQGYLLLSLYTAYLVVIGGDFPWWFRFYVPLLPLPLLGLVALFLELARALHARLGGASWLRGLGLALGLALVAPPSVLAWPRGETAISSLVQHTGENLESLVLFFFRKLPRESYIAASAVGMVGYFTDLRILDAWGLNDHEIAHRPVKPDSRNVFGHDKTDWDYVLTRHPDFIFTYRARNAPFPPSILGYVACWHTYKVPYVLLYRRSYPLRPEQRSLGMPPGARARPVLPPTCNTP